MSNLNEEDIARLNEAIKESKNEPVEIEIPTPMTTSVEDDLTEWSRLITELSENEIELFELKEKYELASEKIIDETDFKAIYGKNNAEVRKQHVKSILYADYLVIKDLEFSIDYLKRRISYLKQLIHTKTVLREVKE